MVSERLPERPTTHSNASSKSEGPLFSQIGTTPVPATAPFLPDSANIRASGVRNTGIPPRNISDQTGSEALRFEFLAGARALGLDTKKKPIHPQQFAIADVMNATGADGQPLYTVIAVSLPRRASKTTSILANLLGRCLEREDYAVAFSAQTGTKARDRFLQDVVRPLERSFPDEDSRPFAIKRGRGDEHIDFDNGSRLVVLPPLSDSFRGDAFDCVVLDESQVHDVDTSEDLLAAILPVFDTREGAQLIVAGTPGEHRSGLLWDTLVDGRNGVPGTGLIEYGAGDSLTEEEIQSDEMLAIAHPGLGTLTTLPKLVLNRSKMKPERWAAEYLGVWPAGGGGRFLNAELWGLARLVGTDRALPEHFTLGMSVHQMQSTASLSASWRDDYGNAHIMLLEHQAGVSWVVEKALAISRKYRVGIAHDTFGPVLVEVEALGRAKPRPTLMPQSTKDVQTAAATLMKALDNGTLKHYDQEGMDSAAALAVKRAIGTGGGWGIGRGDKEDDIGPLESASYALHAFDATRRRAARAPIMA